MQRAQSLHTLYTPGFKFVVVQADELREPILPPV